MQWFYVLFNICILSAPLAGSLLWYRTLWYGWRRLLMAFVFVSGTWIVMDAVAVAQGWWSYNTSYIIGARLFNLPIEEIAFFFVVPFACLVVFMMIRRYMDGIIKWSTARYILLALGTVTWLFASAYHDKSRTGFDSFIAIITFGYLWFSPIITTRAFWYWNITILTLCLVCNSFLTGLPVVIYNESFMSGVRLGTIPVEDFLYNFSLLNLFLLVAAGRGLTANAPPRQP